jgi:glycosyltransferase involved in cell wall biosynthesis
MTIGNYPRKVDEYLAAGKPVVATKTEAMEMFVEQVFLCNNKEEYIGKIQEALLEAKIENKIRTRKKLAKSHTWAASVNLLYQLIIKTYKEHAK